MADYKIVASDLDGTFLNPERGVSAENWQAVHALTEKGVHFVPCTGRTLMEMDPEIRDNLDVRYIIHSDGAVIYDKETDRRITMCMPHEVGHRLLDILRDYEVLLMVRHNKYVYVDSTLHNEEMHAYCNVGEYYSPVICQLGIPKENFEAFCRSLDEIEMINCFFHSEEEFEECKTRILSTGDYLIAPADKYMEIFHVSAGKGNALLQLAKVIGVDRAQTIGVGDSLNDITCVREAGLGLAMANACDELKEIADEIICSNDEHAVKYILEHYI